MWSTIGRFRAILDASPSHPPCRPGRGLALICWATAAWAAVLVIICLHANGHYVYDDTYITLRYARHLAEGHGPVWNLTGDRVEGFSSPLHLLLVSLATMLHIPELTSARLIGYTSHAALVVFVWRFVSARSGVFAGVLAAALVGSSWPILVWDAGGLETPLFAALSMAGTLTTLGYMETSSRRKLLAGATLLGFAVLTRPDGAVFVAGSLLSCGLLGSGTLRQRLRDIGLAALLCVAINIPWEIFRLYYYHAPLPNTYYAKVMGVPFLWRLTSGLAYWRYFLHEGPFLPLLVVFAAVVVVIKKRVQRFDLGLWLIIALYAAYIVDAGGDHMMAFRFMVPMIPLMSVALVLILCELGTCEKVLWAAMISAALCLLSTRQVSRMVENPRNRDWAGTMGEAIGRYISTHWIPGSTVAVNVAGTTAYFADQMYFIDMLGLNDRTIAHRSSLPTNIPTERLIGHLKGDGASVFARRPAYIIPRGGNGPLPTFADTSLSVGEYELIRQPGFASVYEPCGIVLTSPAGSPEGTPGSFQFEYYQRRDVQTPCIALE